MKNIYMSKNYVICILLQVFSFSDVHWSHHKLNSTGVFLITLLNWFIIIFACIAVSQNQIPEEGSFTFAQYIQFRTGKNF